MSKIEINEKVKLHKATLKTIGTQLFHIADKFGANDETKIILQQKIGNINDNFLFVIVGEVNAGKSSFVNALLDAKVCATSHDICTQNVQKIVHGESDTIIKNDNEDVVLREYPAEILKEITIVDTPGTNSKVINHQIITERFIPQCNLVVFVFFLANIHVESAWELFRNIKDKWSKKVVFVLTQADRFSEEEIAAYQKTLVKYANEEGVQDPTIFATSSKQEINGEQDKSGFEPVRTYINNNVLKDAALGKVRDDIKTLKTLLSSIETEFDIRKNKYKNDQKTRTTIKSIIEDKEALARSNVKKLTDKCLAAYDSNTQKTVNELKRGVGFFALSFKSIKSIFGGENTEQWLERVNKEHIDALNRDINAILSEGTDIIKSDIQYMVVGVKNELDNLKDLNVKPNVMFDSLDVKRTEIIYQLKTNLTDFINKSPVFKGDDILNRDSLDYQDANIATGIAAIGGVITAITQSSILDITGGIATALGLLVAGGIATTKKGRYLREVQAAFDDNRKKLSYELGENLISYITNIKTQILRQFGALDHHLQSEANRIAEYDKMSKAIKNEFKTLEEKI